MFEEGDRVKIKDTWLQAKAWQSYYPHAKEGTVIGTSSSAIPGMYLVAWDKGPRHWHTELEIEKL